MRRGRVRTAGRRPSDRFFHGAALDDPAGLLEGAGKRMRHVKLRWGEPAKVDALNDLIAAAYRDIRLRLDSED